MPIVFENEGELDIAAITTFGASVKKNPGPIGHFGTGLKYALAVLIRHGLRVEVHAGFEVLNFGSAPMKVRDEEFQFVTMNGERLAFTTQLGRDWELWMAFRELECNALDENGTSRFVDVGETFLPGSGKTSIFVFGEAFEDVWRNRALYFAKGDADLEAGGLKIRRHSSQSFFYRGVRVLGLPSASVYCYDDTQVVELTEDRTAKHAFMIPYRIARVILAEAPEDIVRGALTAAKGSLEHGLDYDWASTAASETFLRVCGELINSGVKVPASAHAVWKKAQPEKFEPVKMEMTDVHTRALTSAIRFCTDLGFPVSAYPIVCCVSLGHGVFGRAYEGRIYIAERAFDLGGAKQVASTLIEEWAHLAHGLHDCTRDMQNWLFDRMVSVGERLVGEAALPPGWRELPAVVPPAVDDEILF